MYTREKKVWRLFCFFSLLRLAIENGNLIRLHVDDTEYSNRVSFYYTKCHVYLFSHQIPLELKRKN